MKNSSSNSPTLLTYQNEDIDNSERIANIFNNYFSNADEKTQAKITIHIQIVLITSHKKILTRFSFHPLTKKKLNLFSPPFI